MEKKFSIQSRVYAQPLNNNNYNFFLPQEAKAFLIAPPVYSDFPLLFVPLYVCICWERVCGEGLGICTEAKACS